MDSGLQNGAVTNKNLRINVAHGVTAHAYENPLVGLWLEYILALDDYMAGFGVLSSNSRQGLQEDAGTQRLS